MRAEGPEVSGVSGGPAGPSRSERPASGDDRAQDRPTWFWWPRVEWSLMLIGLCIFTTAIITFRLPVGEIGIAIALVGMVVQSGRFRAPFPVWLFGAYVLWAYVTATFSIWPGVVMEGIQEHLKLLVIMLVAVNALRTEGQLRFYLLYFVICFMLYPVRGTLLGSERYFGRWVWVNAYANPNHLALMSLIAGGMAMGLMAFSPPRTLIRLFAGASAATMLLVILLTQSRGVFIGLVAGMGFALFHAAVRRPGRAIAAAFVASIAIAVTVPASTWERLAGIRSLTSESTITELDDMGSAAQRYEIQKIAWGIFLDHPVVGVGLGAYSYANAANSALGRRDTHNTYLNLAAELGVPGLILWCTLVGATFAYAVRQRRRAGAGPLAEQQVWIERTLTACLVAGLFGSYTKLTFPYILLATLWCSARLLAESSGPGAPRGPEPGR